MALSVENRIINQIVNGQSRYYYLYEPLPILATETVLEAKVLSVDLKVKDVNTNVEIETLTDYAIYDINPGQPINLDVMKIIQQYHNADLWKISSVDDIINSPEVIVSKYAYDLIFSVDVASSVDYMISIIPIIGGRTFQDFEPLVSNNFPYNDFQKYGVNISTRWKDYPIINTVLNIPASNSEKVSLTSNINTEGECPCGGMLYWKSRLGGWMQWGFDIKIENKVQSHQGNIEVGMFKVVRNQINVQPYVPTDYSSVNFEYTMTLKSLSLSDLELKAVSSISQSPVCYFLKEPNGRLELMRVTSATTPINNLIRGGDFSVSLKNISKTDFKTR